MDTKDIPDKVIAMLRELAGAAGQTVEKLWPMAVRATFADGVADLAVALISIVTVVFIAKVFLKPKPIPPQPTTTFQAHLESFSPSEVAAARTSTLITLSLVCSLLVMIFVAYGLPKVIAPEGKTIFRILGR